MSKEKREAVLKVMEELNYHRNVVAVLLKFDRGCFLVDRPSLLQPIADLMGITTIEIPIKKLG